MVEPTKLHSAIPEADRKSIAIMVHGTYAGATDDNGERWWQSGSPFAHKIQSLLPSFIRIADDQEVFHWSGANSERGRSKAAAKLLRHLRSLEDEGHDYHLVGHSHGGSVIWNAMQMSMLIKRPLHGLRSWTTIGTPFMQHRSRGALNIMNVIGLIVGLFLLWPAMAAPRQLLTTLYNVATDNRAAVVLDPDQAISYINRTLRTPVLASIEYAGVAIDRQPTGIRVGSFDPTGGQTLAEYFFATPEGLFLLILMIGMSYFFIHCSVLCISPAIESYRIRLEHRLHQRAFEEYGGRWLGIWSPDDEAINGLRATLDMSVSFVSKMFPREVVYLSDTFALLSRPYYWMLAPVYNRFVHPAVDGKVRNIVKRAAQGNDRPTATLVDVTPYPVAASEFSPPQLPALLNVRLLAFANKHAHELVPKLRALIAQNSFESGLESFSGQLSGKELVHTAYFEQEEILKLIVANMTWDTEATKDSVRLRSMPPWLRKWFVSFKQGMNRVSIKKLEIGTDDIEELAKPRRHNAG